MRKAAVAAALALAGCAVRGTGEAPSPAEPPLPAASSRPLPEEPAALRSLFGPEYDEALAAIGLSRETARITASDFSLVAQGRFPTALFAGLVEDPTLADRWSRTLRDVAFASAGTTENASLYAAARLGVSVRPGLLGDPLAEEVKTAALPGAMEEALAPLMPLGVPPTEAVPPAVQAAAALVLRAARLRAIPWLKRALPEAPRPGGGSRAVTAAESLGSLMEEDSADPLGSARHRFERTAAATDQGYLARAAAEVLMAADRAAGILREAAGGPAFEFRAETTLGTVLLRGGGDDADGEGDRGPFLLRIDTGGDDRYAAGAAASPEVPVSVLLDVSGSDTYESPPDADAFGAGHFGVGVLLDLAGDDRYALAGDRSLGLGAGVFGVGALLDAAGDDAYSGVGFCQGAGAVGWGTLSDLGGTDAYDAYFFSQGFGYVLGAGVLTDLAGNDRYSLNDADLKSPSAQSKDHNSSLGQGFGFGVRADYLDGHSLAGGVGILADREGDDRYSCGVFGQGGGYWMGVGMLLDAAGNDDYRGVWYVQGACAHFAVGILDDGGGDDRYLASMNMAQGAGHDYSLGVLLDRGGNDLYEAPNLSLGGGNADGVGILLDAGGDDSYTSRGITLGHASVATPAEAPTVRHASLTLGVFLDLGGGRDSYLEGPGKPHPFAGDGRIWTRGERVPGPAGSNERGVGGDLPAERGPRNP